MVIVINSYKYILIFNISTSTSTSTSISIEQSLIDLDGKIMVIRSIATIPIQLVCKSGDPTKRRSSKINIITRNFQ